ncbi:CmcI family methyltransferase [Paenibacillus elgii]|nr:CmcI family methyltransferase [Paenibacillus elgii]MCM3268657.1 cephalosporin hydroxylase [Paenibacillus elgii]
MNEKLIRQIYYCTQQKIEKKQEGIPTFFDNLVVSEGEMYLNKGNLSTPLRRVVNTISTSGKERYASIKNRILNCQFSDLDGYSRICSQGTHNCFQWRGRPLFKSSQDMSIYTMLLNDLRPSTIIEIGSTSSSLSWWKDMVKILGIKTTILGVDRIKPFYEDRDIDFIQADVNKINDTLLIKENTFSKYSHPWLIIEDVHINTLGVLKLMSGLMCSGDYLVIEDSMSKQEDIKKWAEVRNNFVVDTYYTDFFGINATSAVNSIITLRNEASNL